MQMWNRREKASDRKIKQLKNRLLEQEQKNADKTNRTK